jgi:hypothetical protein
MASAVFLLVGLAVATTQEFWNVDGCLDSGGAWDRPSMTCVRDGSVRVIPLAYPTWVFAIVAAVSIGILLTASASFWAVLMRRWASARQLSTLSVVASVGVFLGSMVLAINVALDLEVRESKATRLACAISEFMNASSGIYLGFMIAFVARLIAAIQQWRTRAKTR